MGDPAADTIDHYSHWRVPITANCCAAATYRMTRLINRTHCFNSDVLRQPSDSTHPSTNKHAWYYKCHKQNALLKFSGSCYCTNRMTKYIAECCLPLASHTCNHRCQALPSLRGTERICQDRHVRNKELTTDVILLAYSIVQCGKWIPPTWRI